MTKMKFKNAIKNKFRYPFNGQISTEDLFDLSLKQLDTVYANLNAELEKTKKSSLLAGSTEETEKRKALENKLEIVKEIFDDKQKENEAKLDAAKEKERKQTIIRIIEEKENDSLKNMSIDDLKKLL